MTTHKHNDPYRNLDLGAERFLPEEPGTSIEITVTDLKPVQTKDVKAGVIVTGVDDNDTTTEWAAWNLRAKAELRRERPYPGDRLKITFDGRDPDAPNPAMAARWFSLKKMSTSGEGAAEIPFKPVA